MVARLLTGMREMNWIGPILQDIVRNFPPIWVLAIGVAFILAWRMPKIIAAISTGVREHKRVNAAIRAKQEQAARKIRRGLEKRANRKKIKAVGS
jgi:hypothetical protein